LENGGVKTMLAQMLIPQRNLRRILKFVCVLLLICCAIKFYHYNYVANTFGQVRDLRLDGLKEFVCQNSLYKADEIDQCGSRAIYADGDWGITAYYIVFGVETKAEAESIAKFMVEARKKNGQEHIPMNLEVYSISRSTASNGHPSKYKIFDRDL
jgi:hypothetical protein